MGFDSFSLSHGLSCKSPSNKLKPIYPDCVSGNFEGVSSILNFASTPVISAFKVFILLMIAGAASSADGMAKDYFKKFY